MMFQGRKTIWLSLFITLMLISASAVVSGCSATPGSLAPFGLESKKLTSTPFQPVPWTLTPSPLPATPTPTSPPYSMWVDPHIPQSLLNQVELPAEIGYSPDPQIATYQLEISNRQPVSTWIYALVAPFPTVSDGVSADEILKAWGGASHKTFNGLPLLMDEATLLALEAFWGVPSPGAVQVTATEALIQTTWDQRPAWAIVPFETLDPRWKVLEVGGLSPIHKDFDPDAYALTVLISLVGEAPIRPVIPTGNRNPEKMTTLVMTGVTALVRATAFTMEQKGIIYPGKDIHDWLWDADITHISNEVPFAEDCPYPNPFQEGMKFCSDDRYIELLEYVGTDIVELTGDHFGDWGSEAMLHTLKLYNQRSWPYYGGGANLEDGRQAVTLVDHGNRIAFIGCNAKGGWYASAGESNPGAVACDFQWMVSEIQRLRRENYLPIATFQHFEYYTYVAQANQIRDAQTLTEAGAVIVSGSQAHQPQAFEFSNAGFVHHGLGNLFFDQLDVSTSTRQGFIDRHILYDGRHISTELLTIWFEDYARARPMTVEERADLLTVIFQASGW